MCRFAIVLFVFFISIIGIKAQSTKKLKMHFKPNYGAFSFKLNDTTYTLKNGDSIRFTALKFYISSIELFNNSKIVFKEKNSYRLIDVAERNSGICSLNVPKYITFTSIRFNIGIDSSTNVAGALGGDLDPMKGMYWTWQNGYINWKIEGTCSSVPTKNHSFQFHIGGYHFPNNSIQIIQLPTHNQQSIDVGFDIKMLMEAIPLTTQFSIMSPKNEAVLLSKCLSKICSVL
jgi:hypothetical protein